MSSSTAESKQCDSSATEEERKQFLELLKQAQDGDAEAQNNVGGCYLLGLLGNEIDTTKAIYWLIKAADQGFGDAMNNLAICYGSGIGFDKPDSEAATTWFMKAAVSGHPEATYHIGLALNGNKEFGKAFSWFEKGAKLGHSGCQTQLAVCYQTGVGNCCQSNPWTACYWFEQAALQGDPNGLFAVGLCHQMGYFTDKENERVSHPDPYEITTWYSAAASKGQAAAQYLLALRYLDGVGVELNTSAAEEWLSIAARGGLAEAQVVFGERIECGTFPIKDQNLKPIDIAIQWYLKAAEQGNADGLYELGVCFHNGKGTAKDYQQAFRCFQSAIEIDPSHPFALERLGLCYEYGVGLERLRKQVILDINVEELLPHQRTFH